MTRSVPLWEQAAASAEQMQARKSRIGFDAGCWDDVAIARLIALTLYALAHHHSAGVADAPLGRALVLLRDGDQWEPFVKHELESAGHHLGPRHDLDDPVASAWVWVNRTWPDDVPLPGLWDGLTRGIARGLTDNAIAVCLDWAGSAVDAALVEQRGGFPVGTKVRLASGEGTEGEIAAGAWHRSADGQSVNEGPPQGYQVRFRHDGPPAEVVYDDVVVKFDKLWKGEQVVLAVDLVEAAAVS